MYGVRESGDAASTLRHDLGVTFPSLGLPCQLKTGTFLLHLASFEISLPCCLVAVPAGEVVSIRSGTKVERWSYPSSGPTRRSSQARTVGSFFFLALPGGPRYKLTTKSEGSTSAQLQLAWRLKRQQSIPITICCSASSRTGVLPRPRHYAQVTPPSAPSRETTRTRLQRGPDTRMKGCRSPAAASTPCDDLTDICATSRLVCWLGPSSLGDP
jgi:hypothetical protein